jgi:hypothetical protein
MCRHRQPSSYATHSFLSGQIEQLNTSVRTDHVRGLRFPRHVLVPNILLTVILALCVVRLWLMPLPSSLWVDELGTLFVIHFGAAHPSLNAAPQVPQSLYYALPRFTETVFGTSETSYRLSSVLCMGLAFIVLARIAAKLLGPRSAWLVLFISLALRDIDYQADDARPYALGTLVACFCVWWSIRWLDSAKWTDAIGFIVSAALLWRVHLVFWPFYLVLAAYAGFRLFTSRTPVRFHEAILIFTAIAILLIPVARTALLLLSQASDHVIVPRPTFDQLLSALKINVVLGACASGAIFLRCFAWKMQKTRLAPARSDLVLVFGWWLIPPLSLFAFSWITGNSVFVSRYLFLALPGAALVAIVFIRPFVPAEQYIRVSAALGIGVFLFAGHWNRVWPLHHNSDWKNASLAVRQLHLAADTPVICPSPFVEARPPVWTPYYPLPGFLYSHLIGYPIPGRIYPFPFEMSAEAIQDANGMLKQEIPAAHRFVLYGGDQAVRNLWTWFSARPELSSWRSRRLGQFGDVDAIVFEASDVATAKIARR